MVLIVSNRDFLPTDRFSERIDPSKGDITTFDRSSEIDGDVNLTY